MHGVSIEEVGYPGDGCSSRFAALAVNVRDLARTVPTDFPN